MKTGILIKLIPILLMPAILLNACNEEGPPITPAADRPTFLYFFTDD